jgi:pimeloyl-ACP methyl ester carboxylesterase
VRTPASGAKDTPFRDTSPAEMLPLGVKQILIHGVFDGIVPPAIGLRYQQQAKAKGESVELVALENAGHFELIAPWTAAGKVVVTRILEALK